MFALLFTAVLAESIVEMVNNDPTSTWVATEYPASVITAAKFRARLGFSLSNPFPFEAMIPSDAPESFDARVQWPGKILPVRDQASCGSCWAFSVAEAFGDMLEIAGCGRGHLSTQDLVSCDTTNSGCNGGDMYTAQKWLVNKGITTETCLPYVSGSGRVPACPAKCNNGSDIVRVKAASAKQIAANKIQDTLLEYGPLSCGFIVYSDFMSYKSGIYQHKTGSQQGGHAVLMVGWGVEGGINYWICQNSWGASWGEQGHFRILRGSNHCSIETYVTFGEPKC